MNKVTLKSNARILIIKPSSLGDIIHALPTLSALRTRYPDAWIGWLVKQEWSDLLVAHPDLNELVVVNLDLLSWPRLVSRIRHLAYDVTLDLQGLFRTGILSRLSGASRRVGFANAREGSSVFYTDRVALPIPLVKPWRLLDMHAIDRNLVVAQHVGADITNPRFYLPSTDQEQQEVLSFLTEAGWIPGGSLVGIVPLSRGKLKNWGFQQFLETARILSQQENVWIVLIGTASQWWMSELYERHVGRRCINLIGKTTLRHLGIVFRYTDVVIANDSAALHLACAVGAQVVALMGPTHPLATGPYGPRGHVLLNENLSCRPCGQQTCRNPHYIECLSSITVEQVVEVTKGILAKKP